MAKAGKLNNVQLEITKLDIDILGVSEALLPGNGIVRNNDFTTLSIGSMLVQPQ